MEDRLASIILILGTLVLVGSGFAARRLPAGHMAKLALLWAAIFAAMFLLVRLVTG